MTLQVWGKFGGSFRRDRNSVVAMKTANYVANNNSSCIKNSLLNGFIMREARSIEKVSEF